MRALSFGLAIFAAALAGPALGADETEQIEDSEMPGSEIQIFGDGLNVTPGGTPMLPADPAFPDAGDPIDNELPGEGPESLSGPDDDDPLPE